jgi:antitoxin component YwqK of YwqJK toxin-antitoxin module
VKLYSYYFQSLIVALCSQWASGEQYPNFDDRSVVTKIISNALVGEWDEFNNKSLPFAEFRQKQGLQYERAGTQPYSGFYIQLDGNKRIRNLRHFQEGVMDGPVVSWRENGLKFHQGNYSLGKIDGIQSSWSENNTKILEQNYQMGKLDGLSVRWFRNGQKSSEQIFQNGKIVTAIGWKPNGERCPSTRVVDGVGMLVIYNDFGEEADREEYVGNKQTRSIERYSNGNTREEGYYKNNLKDGLWIYYRVDGKEHFRVTYLEGKRVNAEFSKGSLENRF